MFSSPKVQLSFLTWTKLGGVSWVLRWDFTSYNLGERPWGEGEGGVQQGWGGEVSPVRPSPFPHTTPWRLVEFEFYKGGWLAWHSLSVAPIFIHAQSTACVGCSLGQEKENSVRVEVWSSVLGRQWSYQSQLLSLLSISRTALKPLTSSSFPFVSCYKRCPLAGHGTCVVKSAQHCSDLGSATDQLWGLSQDICASAFHL